MAGLRARIDFAFETLARSLFRHRCKTLLLLLVLSGALWSQLPTITTESSMDSYFHEEDPVLIAYDAFKEQFGQEGRIIAAVNPPDVFDTAFLEKLRDFHRALEAEVPYLDEVKSLINVRHTRGEGERLIVEDLLGEIPQTPEAMAALKKTVLSSELYPNAFISEDGGLTVVLLKTIAYSPEGAGEEELDGFEEDRETPGEESAPGGRPELTFEENREVVAAVERVAARFEGADFSTHLAGGPLFRDFYRRAILENVRKFTGLSFLAFAILLFILFRRVTGVFLPLIVVLISMLSTVSLMALMGAPITMVTGILPSLLVAVGLADSIHLLTVFYRDFQQRGDKEGAVIYAMGHSGLPILMTSVTTAAGLASFSTSGLVPVADLGIYGAAGVMIAFLYTILLLPPLLALLPVRQRPRLAGKRQGAGFDRLLGGLADFATRHAWSVVIVSGAIIAAAATGLPSLRFAHNPVGFLPHASKVRQDIHLVDREMKGSVTVEVIVDTGRENGLYEPAVMTHLESLSQFAEEYRDEAGQRIVGKTTSVVDVLKETHRALNENRAEFYRIPRQRELIAQELLLFENSGSDDLASLVDSRFGMARVSAKVPFSDMVAYVDFVTDLEGEAGRLFGGAADVRVTGLLKLGAQTIWLSLASIARSYVIAGVVITLLMIFLLGSIRFGLLSMVANLAPIIVIMGVMGWSGLNLNIATMLLGTIALGLAVDDTIHFFHGFRRYYAESGNAAEATRRTLLTTGRALLFTTLVLVTGFGLYNFASLLTMVNFGRLIAITLIVALLADLLLAPAMLELYTRTAPGRRSAEKWGASQGLLARNSGG